MIETHIGAERAEQVEALLNGTEVEVRRRFDQAWAHGFVIDDVDDAGYWLRRKSDGALLPVAFGADDVRSARLS